MNSRNLVLISLLSFTIFSSTACTLRLGAAAVEQPALGHSIYMPRPKNFSPQMSSRPMATKSVPQPDENFIYLTEVREKFYQEQFLWLDAEAKRLRSSKERLHDGAWKLYILYAAVGNPNYSGEPGEEVWQRYLSLLRKWVQLQPDSVTARVAMGEFFVNYGWHARGNGYSSTVTQEGWRLFETRLGEAEQALAAARSLPERCPHWYQPALRIAQATGWDLRSFNQVFDEAVNMEPDYYYFYRVKAMYLLPRWHGQPGDWEKFTEEASNKLGGERGDMIFFLTYTYMLSFHDLTFMNQHHDAWPRLLAGFRALEKRFGRSMDRANEACFLASSVGDFKVAKELFLRIGDKPDLDVWRSSENFEMMRSAALQYADKL